MKNYKVQLFLVICLLMEVVLTYKITSSTNIIFKEFFTGFAVFVLLVMIRLTSNLIDSNCQNHDENSFD